jgi:hypothetical protein
MQKPIFISAALAAAGAILLAGCGAASSAEQSSGKASVPAATGFTQTTQASQTSTGSASGTPRCTVSQLSVRQMREDGAAGSRGLDYAFTNRSAARCSLYGYPGLGMLDKAGERMLTDVLRSPSVVVPRVAERQVLLAPGGRAWFYAGYSDVSTGSCPAAARLEVTPPDAYGHLVIPTGISPCGGVIHVSPVFAGMPRV